jgi:GH24 family phage-related lysozyme (muramidase)
MASDAVRVSDDTIEFIKRWETNGPPILEAYHDIGTRWSIGYGTISHEGEAITEDVAERRFRVAVEDFADALATRITVALSPEQETALISAAYNLGVFAVQPVIALVNRGQPMEAAAALQHYVFAGGKKLEALVRRRAAEAALLEVAPMTRGAPRVEYARTYRLVNSDANMQAWLAAAEAAYALRQTIGFSADDAGIGDLDSRRVILQGHHPAGMPEWFAQHYPGVDVMTDTAPAPPVAPRPPVSQTKALVGLHGSADGSWGHAVLPETVQLIKQGRIKSYKGLSNESADTVKVLRSIDPDIFIMVRLFAKVNRENPSASAFVEAVGDDAVKWYNSGAVRHFEVHNEPNLKLADETGEGMWTAWKDGAEFAMWFRQVVNALKPLMPDALFGYPGLSPGWSISEVRYDPIRFLEESWEAMDQADFICAHAYWTTPAEMYSEDGGQWYKRVPHAGKPLMVTEFSNPSHDVDKHEKGKQYVDYYASLENVHSAYSFLSTSSSGFEAETWHGSDIAHTVGQRDGSTA